MISPKRNDMPVLPELKLPLLAWLIAAPIACIVVGFIGFAVSLAIGVDQPVAAIWGGVVLLTAFATYLYGVALRR